MESDPRAERISAEPGRSTKVSAQKLQDFPCGDKREGWEASRGFYSTWSRPCVAVQAEGHGHYLTVRSNIGTFKKKKEQTQAWVAAQLVELLDRESEAWYHKSWHDGTAHGHST